MSVKQKRAISETEMTCMKIEVKEENQTGDNDVLSARDRLKGALRGVISNSGDDSGSEDERNKKSVRTPIAKRYQADSSPTRTSIRKRRRTDPYSSSFHHTYVMKLFDRSVDLAQFEEDTPLYPICRAWMANQPRNPQLVIKRRVSSPEPSAQTNEEVDVTKLPSPDEEMINRVPSPLPEQIEKDKNTDFLNYSKIPPLPKEQLLKSHLERWGKVRRKWHEQAQKFEDRYHASTDILAAIYNRAQENMA